MLRHNRYALIGFLLALPLTLIFIAVVFNQVWMETVFKSVLTDDGNMPNTLGWVVMFAGLGALPVALIVTLYPLVRYRTLKLTNLLVAAMVIAVMYPTLGGLVKDFINCDIRQIPNCD